MKIQFLGRGCGEGVGRGESWTFGSPGHPAHAGQGAAAPGVELGPQGDNAAGADNSKGV